MSAAAAQGVSTGLKAQAGTLQAFGQFAEGRAQKSIADAQAHQLNLDADRAVQLARLERDRERRRGSRAAASQRALFAARGVDPGFGSAALVADDLSATSLLNQLLIDNQALARASGLRSQAAIRKFQGRFARDKGILNANVTLSRTGAEVASGVGSISSLSGG